jgi:hypothetical protein
MNSSGVSHVANRPRSYASKNPQLVIYRHGDENGPDSEDLLIPFADIARDFASSLGDMRIRSCSSTPSNSFAVIQTPNARSNVPVG